MAGEGSEWFQKEIRVKHPTLRRLVLFTEEHRELSAFASVVGYVVGLLPAINGPIWILTITLPLPSLLATFVVLTRVQVIRATPSVSITTGVSATLVQRCPECDEVLEDSYEPCKGCGWEPEIGE